LHDNLACLCPFRVPPFFLYLASVWHFIAIKKILSHAAEIRAQADPPESGKMKIAPTTFREAEKETQTL